MNQRNQEDGEWGQSDQDGRPESHYSVPGNMQEMQMSNQDSYQPPVREPSQTITHQFNSPLESNRMQGTIDHFQKSNLQDDKQVDKTKLPKVPKEELETPHPNQTVIPEKKLKNMVRDDVQKSMSETSKKRKKFADKEKFRKKAEEFDGAEFKFHGSTHYFDPVSLYCLNGENKFRRYVVWLITWPAFDTFITIVILINSVMLGMRNMSFRMTVQCEDDDSRIKTDIDKWNENLETAGVFLTAIFLFEAVAKIIGMGFVSHKTGYLRDYWNWLDFFVVVVSILDFFPNLTQYKSLKVLRTLRILRPLRSINKIKRMKVYINALLKSLPGLTTVVFFLSFVLSIFGIFGIHQFLGLNYRRCRTTLQPHLNPEWIAAGIGFESRENISKYMPWEIDDSADLLCLDDLSCEAHYKMSGQEYDPNRVFKCGAPMDFNLTLASDNVDKMPLIGYNIIGFENFGKAMLTIFTAITLEGWTELMYNYMESNSPILTVLYFFLLVFFGAFVAINLVLAQIMESFYETTAKQEEQENREKEEKEELERQERQDKEREDKERESKLADTNAAITQTPGTKMEFGGAEIQSFKGIEEVRAPKPVAKMSSLPSIDMNDPKKSMAARQIATIEQNIQDNPDEAIIDDQYEQMRNSSQQQERGSSLGIHTSNPGILQHKIDSQPDVIEESNVQQIVIEGDKEFETIQDSDQSDECLAEQASRRRAKTNCILNLAYQMVTMPFFNFVIFLMIIGNTVVLAYDGYPRTEVEVETMKQLNDAFTWIFFGEMILKIIGLGPRNYFSDSFNLFDSIVVMFSLIDFTISMIFVNKDNLGSAGEALQALRALRLLRVIKLARSWTALQDILKRTMRSLSDIQYFSVLLFLFMYIMALLGIELFAYKCRFDHDDNLIKDIKSEYAHGVKTFPPRENFETIFDALTTVFIVIIGEDWQHVMYKFVRALSVNAAWYFVVVFVMGNFMLLSLFTAILLSNFDDIGEAAEAVDEENKEFEQSECFMSSPGKTMDTVATTYSTPKQKMNHMMVELKYQYIAAFGTQRAKQKAAIERNNVNSGMSVMGSPIREGQVVPEPLDSIEDEIKEDLSADFEDSEIDSAAREGKKTGLNFLKTQPVPIDIDYSNQRQSLDINIEEKVDAESQQTARKLEGESQSLVYKKTQKNNMMNPTGSLEVANLAREKQLAQSESKQQRMKKVKMKSQFYNSNKDDGRPLSAIAKEQDPQMPRRMQTENLNGKKLEPPSIGVDQITRKNTKKNLGQESIQRMRSGARQSLTHLNVQLDKQIKNNEKSEKLQNMQRLKLHGNSLYCFSKTNKFRCFCFDLIHRSQFDQVILFFILFSTVLMAVESPLLDPKGQEIAVLKILDKIMTVIFVIELLIKVVAYGLIFNGKTSYLKDGWSQIDFIIVLASISSMAFENYDQLSFLKVFRMVRILKPLRMISRIRGLQLAIMSLIKSIPDIVNLLLIVMFFIFLLAILMTTLFAGKFYRCKFNHIYLDYEDEQALIKDKWDCLNYGGEWVKPDINFDSLGESWLSLFTIQSTEGWIPVMWNAVDATGVEKQPVRNNHQGYILLFIVLILLLCLLFLNLFVGVVIVTFNKESENLTLNNLLNKKQEEYIQVQMMAYNAKPKITLRDDTPDISKFRAIMIRIVNNPHFDNFIMVSIGLNTLILTAKWYGMSAQITSACETANSVFMVIFGLEAIIKLIAMRATYFKDNWNNFDFIVVISSSLAIIVKIFKIGIDVNAQTVIIRILRVLRVLRLIKRAKKLQIIFETIMIALPAMGSLGALLMLFVFLFAIVGMQMFAFVQWQDNINYNANFQTFTNSFLLLIRAATGEGWNSLMYDLARGRDITFQCDTNEVVDKYQSYLDNDKVVKSCGLGVYAIIYFFLFQVVVAQVFLNLFIAIVVDTFMGQSKQHNLPLSQLDIDTFIQMWSKYDPDGTTYMDRHDFEDFLIGLCESETDFFAEDMDEVLDPIQRENLIIHLEIPMHKKLKAFMFYDVLLTLCRYTCQQVLLKEEKAELRDMIFVIRQCQGGITEEQLKIEVNKLFEGHAESNFKKVFDTSTTNPNIELIKEINKKAAWIAEKTMAEVDFAIDIEGFESHSPSVYTSKHVYLGVRVVRIWKDAFKRRKNGTIDVPSSQNFESAAERSETRSVGIKACSPSNSSTMYVPPTITSGKGNLLSYSPDSNANNKAKQSRKGFATRKIGSYGDVEIKVTRPTMAPIREENPRDMMEDQLMVAASSPPHRRFTKDNYTTSKETQVEGLGATQGLGFGLDTVALFDQSKGRQPHSPLQQAQQNQWEEEKLQNNQLEPDAGADDFINEMVSISDQGFNELAERNCDTINRAQQLSQTSMVHTK